MIHESQKVIALSQGDPAGIGPDISLFAWSNRQKLRVPPFLFIGDVTALQERAEQLKIAVNPKECTPEDAVSVFADQMPVLNIECLEKVVAGQPSSRNAEAIINAIETAVILCQDGRVSSVVTNPISKSVLYEGGFKFPGHTEFLADLASRELGHTVMPVMMLSGPELKTVPVTIHIPLRDVPMALNQQMIMDTCRIVHHGLVHQFGISSPRLAIAGLNPHAGENGALGHEDDLVIAPAIQQLVAEGIHAVGPLPADTMFHARARETYDVAVCMYHDQALIPAKALGFDDAVNVTLGLPFIRTSPDHGTAFSLAGKGIARADSLIAALKLAAELSFPDKGGARGGN